MAEIFILRVQYKNEQRNFEAELQVYGYTHKVVVVVEGTEIIYEPDEESNYRALIPESQKEQKLPDPELLKIIAHQLEKVLK